MRSGEPLDDTLMKNAHEKYVNILAGFFDDGLYADVGPETAYKKTELVVMALLSRKGVSDDFPYAALFREESSATRAFNHDFATFSTTHGKTPVQVKSSDYLYRKGERSRGEYSPDVVMAIYSDIIQLGHREDNGDSLARAIIAEARGEQLDLDDRNLLNGASAYLTAALYAVRNQKELSDVEMLEA
jgi:hypothetical protein